MDRAELRWLEATSATMSSVAEVGCWKGRSTFALLCGCSGPVYAVDHWKGSKDELNGAHREALTDDIFAQFLKNTSNFDNLVVVKHDSKDAAGIVPDVDMVFIDAGHSYEDIAQDMILWKPKAKKLICGHDSNFQGVGRVLLEMFGYVNKIVGSIWAYEI